jgi:hypothetical protein
MRVGFEKQYPVRKFLGWIAALCLITSSAPGANIPHGELFGQYKGLLLEEWLEDPSLKDSLEELRFKDEGTINLTITEDGSPLCQDSCRVHIIEKKSSRRRQEREECRSTVKSSKSKWYER